MNFQDPVLNPTDSTDAFEIKKAFKKHFSQIQRRISETSLMQKKNMRVLFSIIICTSQVNTFS